jgi:sugar phosphate permease
MPLHGFLSRVRVVRLLGERRKRGIMIENPERKVLTYRWVVFWVMAVAYVFVYFHRLCPAVVAVDLQRDFAASGALTGLMASAYFYPYAVMQFPAGLLADSLGPRLTATVSLVVAALGSFLFGLSPNMEMAVFGRIIVGLGVSMVFIALMKLNAQWFRVREFAFVTGLIILMGGVGALTAATPLALMTARLGWRASFQVIAVGTLIIAVLVWLLVRNRPQDLGWPPISELEAKGPGGVTAPVVIPLWEGARRVVTDRYFWPVAVWFFFLLGVFFGFGGLWAGHYLADVYHLSPTDKGNVLSMIAVGLIVGSPSLSFLSDRVLFSRKKVLILCSAVIVAELLLLNLVPSGLPIWSLYVLMFLFSVASSAIVVIGFTTTKELFPVEIAGTSVGTMNLFPFLGGAALQPFIGWLLEQYPRPAAGGYGLDAYKAMLMTLFVSSVIALVSTFFMKETFPGRR